ncbi:flagellin [Chitinispirillales bacterium ANBcel5]|uniref:flagellin N-terminal helical domain-containing protein n=1 Tax=Cellulosispirillum alkaliphilum TaxID=3039283 RepID=UPI002A57A851|nr:flagellin [Chitinispirillales bacterium ANBcel5]
MPRINNNVPAMITGNALRSVDRNLQKSLEKLSTGLRINRAADDAAGLSVSEQLRTQVRGLNMGSRNIQDGVALLSIAEGALIEVNSMLQRMRELSIQAANDTLTPTERGYIGIEIDQLKEEIDRVVNGTQYNSQKLLNGDAPWGAAPGGIFHIGPNNDPTADTIQYQIDPMDTASLGIDGANLQVDTQENAAEAITTLDEALNRLNSLRADLGAVVNRMEHALTNQENQEQNMQAAESVIRDADFAAETTKFTRNQILSQSSTSMLAQANMAPQSVLSLLG